MSGYRRIRFHGQQPPWAGNYQPRRIARGLGDWIDDMEPTTLDPIADTTTLDELVVTASPPPVDLVPSEPLLSPPLSLAPPTPEFSDLSSSYSPPVYSPPLYLAPPTPEFPDLSTNYSPPVFTPTGAGGGNPLTNLLKSLFPKSPAAKAPGGSALTPPKPLNLTTPKPPATAAAAGHMVNPELAAGMALAGLVFAAALLSGHHDRRQGRQGRARR